MIELITQKEVASMLRMSYGTITNLRRRGFLAVVRAPYAKSKVLYVRSEVEDFINQNKNTIERRIKKQSPPSKEWRIE